MCLKVSFYYSHAAMIRIFLVDDHAVLRQGLRALLADQPGITIVGEASNGQELLDQLPTIPADVVLLDLNMPGMTGEDLIRVLRADRPELPVVVVTGSSPRGGLDELRRHGGGHGPLMLLHKPIDYADLVDTVRRAVFPKRLRPAAYNEL